MERGQAPAARLILVPRQLWILADAVAEIEDARVRYEVQRPGLGDDFLGAVETAVESLLDFPDACPIDYRDAHCSTIHELGVVSRFAARCYNQYQNNGAVWRRLWVLP
jgi:hypothetical protein